MSKILEIDTALEVVMVAAGMCYGELANCAYKLDATITEATFFDWWNELDPNDPETARWIEDFDVDLNILENHPENIVKMLKYFVKNRD